jgi:hypothetical protein
MQIIGDCVDSLFFDKEIEEIARKTTQKFVE